MPTAAPPILLTLLLHACLSITAAAQKAAAQNPTELKKFPSQGWQPVTITNKQRQRLPRRSTAELIEVGLASKGTLQIQLTRPEGYAETVVTNSSGALLARTKGKSLRVKDQQIGARYVVYLVQPQEQRYLRFFEGFVKYPHREFPSKGWRPKSDANLALQKARQSAPKTMLESFDKPHHIAFEPAASKHRVLYVLTKFEAGGKEAVASQSLSGKLRFWPQAKRGESFRIYQVFPDDQSYRVTKSMSVEKSFPIGR